MKASLAAQLVKNPPAMQETPVQFLGWEGISWRRDRLPTPVFLGFPCGSTGKKSARNAGDLGSIPGLGRSPGEGKGYPLQCSGLENSMDCVVYGVSKSQTRLSDFRFHWCFAEPLVGHLFLPSSPGNRLSWDATWSYAELVMSLTKSTEPVSPSKHQGPTG